MSFEILTHCEAKAHEYVFGMKDERYYQRHHVKGAQEDAHLPVSTVHDPYP